MKFNRSKPIFQQIIEKMEDAIVNEELLAEQRIPGIRDYALTLGVNHNTVVKSFSKLEQAGYIFKRRGLGYFVCADAKAKIIARRRKEFLNEELPQLVAAMHLLDISPDVVTRSFNSYKK